MRSLLLLFISANIVFASSAWAEEDPFSGRAQGTAADGDSPNLTVEQPKFASSTQTVGQFVSESVVPGGSECADCASHTVDGPLNKDTHASKSGDSASQPKKGRQ